MKNAQIYKFLLSAAFLELHVKTFKRLERNGQTRLAHVYVTDVGR